MKTLTWIASLLIALVVLPTCALADDLDVTFYDSVTDFEQSWTVRDVEPGPLPDINFETVEGEGFVIEMEFEDLGDQVELTAAIYSVTFKKRKDGVPRTVARSRLIGPRAPSIRVVKGEAAYVKQGQAVADPGDPELFQELTIMYVTTEDEGE